MQAPLAPFVGPEPPLVALTMTAASSIAKPIDMSKKRKNSGFTIIELMITLVVAAILLTVGVPSYQSLVRNNRLTTQVNTFVGSLQLSRSEAIKRRVPGHVTALDASDAGNEWGPGWRVWIDLNSSGAFDAGEDLRTFSNLQGNTMNSVENANDITFRANGTPTGFAVGALGFASFDLCPPSNSHVNGRQAQIRLTGQIATNNDLACP
jgi:type IV fimbrial biogenesis protein FimT